MDDDENALPHHLEDEGVGVWTYDKRIVLDLSLSYDPNDEVCPMKPLELRIIKEAVRRYNAWEKLKELAVDDDEGAIVRNRLQKINAILDGKEG